MEKMLWWNPNLERDLERGRGRKIWRYYPVGFGDGGGEQSTKEWCPREAGKRKEVDFLLKPPERT